MATKTSDIPVQFDDSFNSDPTDLLVVPYEGDGEDWDRFAAEQEDSTFCHLSGWRSVMEGALGHETSWLVATDTGGTWRGILPLVHVKSALFGDYLLSMPFLNYGGPVGTPAARWALAEAAREQAEERGVELMELRARQPMPSRLQVSNRKLTVLLDLPDEVDDLWMGHLRGKVRTMIRKPRKEGMVARFGPDLLRDFYDVFSVNMRDLGTPVLPYSFFEAARDAFGERMWLGAVYSDEQPVAAGCGFLWQGEFEMTWASSLQEYQRYTVNEFLYWSFMERLIEEGADTFNFGRCTPGSGTHQWKQKWQGRDVPLPWLQWTPAATPDQERPVYRAATWVWSRLPVSLTNRIGPLVSSSLP